MDKEKGGAVEMPLVGGRVEFRQASRTGRGVPYQIQNFMILPPLLKSGS